jgi:hypothetical protein
MHFNIANGKTLASVNGLDTAQALAQRVRERAVERVHGRLGDVQRRFPQAQHLRQSAAMIVVFVGNENAVEALNAFFDGRQARESFALAESGINQEAGTLGLEQGEVPRAAGRQDGDAQADRFPSVPQQILRIIAERRHRVNEEREIARVIGWQNMSVRQNTWTSWNVSLNKGSR